MNVTSTLPEVLTLEEAARYLRLAESAIERLATGGELPGRLVDREWRFLRIALDDWLRGEDSRPQGETALLLAQFGRFADDWTLDTIRNEAYARRKRPEVDREAVR